MGRGKAWFREADMNLAQGWSQASHDPIIGNMQDGKSFWQTIKSNFMKLSKPNEGRSISSLQSRWSDANKRTSKFNGTFLLDNVGRGKSISTRMSILRTLSLL